MKIKLLSIAVAAVFALSGAAAIGDETPGSSGYEELFKKDSVLNVDSALIYIAANTVLCNYDSYNNSMKHNYYLYENEDGIFDVLTWDVNMSFGGRESNVNIGIDTPIVSGSMEESPLISKLLAIDEYKEKYYGYIKEMMAWLEKLKTRVNELKSVIKPYVENDTTLAGFRAISEAIGAEVVWDEQAQTVTAIRDDTTIVLTIGSDTAYVNGKAVDLLTAPAIIGNSTMIPIRFISETMGMKVSWDGETKLITVNSK